MLPLLFGLATAQAGPHGTVAIGGGPVTSQASVQVDVGSQANVTWGLEARLSTTGPLLADPGWYLWELDEGQMLVQPLLGPSIDVAMTDRLTLGFGVGLDLLSPVRTYRTI
jgi:hypothetical protein